MAPYSARYKKKKKMELPLRFRTIRQSVVLDAAPEAVYDALLSARKHSEFTGSPSTANAKVGSSFTAWDGYISGKNIELLEGKKIVQEWTTTEWPTGYPPSTLEFTLTAKGGGTQLKMVHSGVPAEQADDYTRGWYDAYWNPLRAYLQRKDSSRGVHSSHGRARTRTKKKV